VSASVEVHGGVAPFIRKIRLVRVLAAVMLAAFLLTLAPVSAVFKIGADVPASDAADQGDAISGKAMGAADGIQAMQLAGIVSISAYPLPLAEGPGLTLGGDNTIEHKYAPLSDDASFVYENQNDYSGIEELGYDPAVLDSQDDLSGEAPEDATAPAQIIESSAAYYLPVRVEAFPESSAPSTSSAPATSSAPVTSSSPSATDPLSADASEAAEPSNISEVLTQDTQQTANASAEQNESGDLPDTANSGATTQSSAVSADGYIWPTSGNLTSGFGYRAASVGSTNHKGIDICANTGDPIYAAAEGKVIVSERSSSFGNYIQIQHDNGHVTLYAHCSSLLVSVGERVGQGQRIALMGRTGRATAVHLHFELIINGVNVDPVLYLP